MPERSTELHLSIEVDSDPIAGSARGANGEPQLFSGWMELVAVIEAVRLGVDRAAGAALDVGLVGRRGGLVASAKPQGRS